MSITVRHAGERRENVTTLGDIKIGEAFQLLADTSDDWIRIKLNEGHLTFIANGRPIRYTKEHEFDPWTEVIPIDLDIVWKESR